MKLGLGTVQFGLSYGVTNASGQVPEATAARMLGVARRRGVDLLDTAAAYGNSEAVLGRVLDREQAFRIVSKTVPLQGRAMDDGALLAVEDGLRNSLRNLADHPLDTVLVHHAIDLLIDGGERLYGLLRDWQAAGRIARIGVSVYTGDELARLLAKYRLDVVQLPLNVFDQRLPKAGWIHRLRDAGVEVHARSLFLQGVLLAPPDTLPSHLGALSSLVAAFRDAAAAHGLSPAAACLSYAATQGIDYGIVGAQSDDQLMALCDAHEEGAAATGLDWSRFALEDESLINPARWNRPAC